MEQLLNFLDHLNSHYVWIETLHLSRILSIKIPAKNASFIPKYVHLQDWFLKYEQNEVPVVSGSNQNIEMSCKNKLKLTELKVKKN